ncbi:hypothetical protein [Pseudomonas chlororaphis]|uniref:hypothetical protein n=1 Tax=Pseudomonas chlororaphis TaxID=587753 RepID=UPI0023668522|nr:hypothetical protein [Pseudomonas chlororaphis]WDG52446.1 hypothetical protein PUP76_21605 [Pseudomonas chlororaphis]WDH86537.1 hypothetical protein PUP74_20580 [Pseudomonas chlororaphis]
MNNELRALLERITAEPGYSADGLDPHERAIQELRALLAQPAPPAGVEPLIHINPAVLFMLRGEGKTTHGGITFSLSKPVGGWTVPLYEQHVVTRLQAEVDRLNRVKLALAEQVARHSDNCSVYRAELDALKAARGEPPKSSGSLDFDGLLAEFHAAVWEAAADEEGRTDYDMAGVDIAKKLQAMFRANGAHPQGEPVVWLDPDSGRKANTISAALKKYNEAKGGAPAAAAAIYTVPLYAAPVAVVLPERKPEPSCMTALDDDREAAIYNSALDDVARLNSL